MKSRQVKIKVIKAEKPIKLDIVVQKSKPIKPSERHPLAQGVPAPPPVEPALQAIRDTLDAYQGDRNALVQVLRGWLHRNDSGSSRIIAEASGPLRKNKPPRVLR